MDTERALRMLRVMTLVLAGVLLAACGAEDNGEEDAADAQPTVAVTEEAGETPTNPADISEEESPVPAGTPVPEGDGTPVSATGPGGVASPAAATAEPVVDLVPPETDTDSATPGAGDDAARATPGTTGSVPGDGTTGAQVDIGSTPGTASVASPVPDSTPVATPATTTEPVTVTGCEVAEVPPFQGEQTSFVITVDVNFRVGPGTDCDLALGEPIGEFQVVEVIGGPVIREDDGSEWVQIEVLGTQGWVAFEFLAPAPQE